MEKNFNFFGQSKYNLSVAIQPIDDFSEQRFLLGQTKVFLKEYNKAALQNPSGYYVFLDLNVDTFTVGIENRNYFSEEVEVDIPHITTKYPVVTVRMKPNYFYPFPLRSTLIRGKVVNKEGNPVSGASIEVYRSNIINKSEQDGRFVLYFDPLTEDDIKIENGRRYVKINSSVNIRLEIKHPNYRDEEISINNVEEGEEILLTEPVLLLA